METLFEWKFHLYSDKIREYYFFRGDNREKYELFP
jgi:hypothetical protein